MAPGLTTNIPIIQGDIWKLRAASDYITHLNSQTPWGQDGKQYAVTACVQAPSVILVGGIQISKGQSMFNISCPNCHLTNCVDPRDTGQSLLVLRQPPYVVIPTTIEGPWCDDPGMQALEEINKGLSRERRAVRLMVAGLAAVISIIATAITATIFFKQFYQNSRLC